MSTVEDAIQKSKRPDKWGEVHCAICGRHCYRRKRGWHCSECNAYSETDVEVEE